MYGRQRKGQFFLLGAILICTLFFAMLPAHNIVGTGKTLDMSILSENLKSEIPQALNLILLDGGNPAELGDFMDFVRDSSAERYISFQGLWVVFEPDPSSPGDVDIHAGNWMRTPVSLYVVVDSIGVNMNLDYQETATRSLSGVSPSPDMQVSFQDRSWSVTLSRDKTSLYSFTSLTRGNDVVVSETSG